MRGNRISLWLVAIALAFAANSDAKRVFSRGYERAEKTADIIERIREYPSDGGLVLRLKSAVAKESDPLLRQQGLAVISLAMMLRGDLDVSGRARAALLKHYPDSKYARALAPEIIGVACPSCGGEGRIAAPCPVCGGSGNCPMCRGSGRIEMEMARAETVCPKCGGTGQCSQCNGGGMKYRLCHKCRGNGTLLDKEKVQRAYDAVLAGKPETVAEPQTDESMPLMRGREREEEDVLQYF